jgi:hypothetical protein
MDFNATIDLIIKDLDDAYEIIDDLKKYPGVPALQVELAKSKCKSAGAVIAFLKSMKETLPPEKKEPVEPPHQKAIPPQEKKEEHTLIFEVVPVPDIQVKENKPEEVKPPAAEKKEIVKEPVEKTAESAIIADRFSHLSNRFNEQLGSVKRDDDLSAIMNTKPLTSLSEAIGVNDRFLFIREIFAGNKETYSQAILKLEKAENLTDARAVIMSYTGDNNSNEAAKQLLDLVKRKLSSNE